MAVHTKCPGCGKAFQAEDKFAGQTAKCPNCRAAVHFPGVKKASSAAPDLNFDDFDDFLNEERGPRRRSAPPPPPRTPPPEPLPRINPSPPMPQGPFDFKRAGPNALKEKYRQIARESGDNSFFTRKELNHLPEILSTGEQVLAFSSGLMDNSTWLIALTDKRIIFIDKGFFYGFTQYTIDLDKITGIYGKAGLIFGEIGIEASSSDKKISMVAKGSVMKFTNKVRDAIEARKNRHGA